MFRTKAILQVCLFTLIGSFLIETQGYAETREGINPPQKRFEISFGRGWALYRMTSINKHYIDEFAKEVGIFDHHINNGPNLFGEVGYFVSTKVSIDFGVTYLQGDVSKKGNVIRMDEQGNVIDTSLGKTSLSTTSVAPELKIKYYFPTEKIDLFISGGAAWCFGRSVLKAETNSPEGPFLEEYRFTAKSLGFVASTGAWYNLNKMISLGAEVGYRLFATTDLKDKNDKAWVVNATGISQKMNLDFSGSFILGGLRLKL
jgi:hypothetical protein